MQDSLETPGIQPSRDEATVSHSQLIKYLKELNRSSLDNSASSGSALKWDITLEQRSCTDPRALMVRITVITANLPNADISRWETSFLTNGSEEWGGTLVTEAGTLSNQIISSSNIFMCPWNCSYGSREAGEQACPRETWRAPSLLYRTLISGPIHTMHALKFANKKVGISFQTLRFSEESTGLLKATGSCSSFRELLQIWME